MNRLCPMCGSRTEEARCPHDGTATLVLAQNPDSRLTEGTEVNGRYRIGAMIGQGGFGAVYRATSLTTGQAMAVKVLGVSLDSDESELIQRFFAEAQITAGLKHPNTIRVFDFGQTEGGALYIAMELLSGQALNELLRDRRKNQSALTQAETLNIAVQTLRSLTEAHMSGLVHRDLKPHNIFLNDVPGDEPVVKVLDFGIAKRLGSNLTGTGQAFGTPTYMSPEQAQNRPIDARSDLYSLGVVLYQCIAGACPFEGDNPLAVLLSHVTDKPDDLFARAAHPVSREFTGLIERALAKDPNDRFAGAVEMRKALEACSPAPTVAEWQQRAVVDGGAAVSRGGTDEGTAAYRPVAHGAGQSPTSAPTVAALSPVALLPAGVNAAPALATAPGTDDGGGSGFTRAFLDRGVALDAAVADMDAAAGPQLESSPDAAAEDADPVAPARGKAGKWLALLAVLLLIGGGGVWLMALGGGGLGLFAGTSDADLQDVTDEAAGVDGATTGPNGEPDVAAGALIDAGEAASTTDGRLDTGVDYAGERDTAKRAADVAGTALPDVGVADIGAPSGSAAVQVLLDSEPQGASLRIDGKAQGETPRTLMVPSGKALRVSLRRKGYRGTEVLLVQSDSPKRLVKLTKLARRAPRRPRPTTPPRTKVKSALEERL